MMLRFVAVPRVFEKMHQQLETAFSEAKGPKGDYNSNKMMMMMIIMMMMMMIMMMMMTGQMLRWATRTAASHYSSVLAGGAGNKLQYNLAEKLLLR